MRHREKTLLPHLKHHNKNYKQVNKIWGIIHTEKILFFYIHPVKVKKLLMRDSAKIEVLRVVLLSAILKGKSNKYREYTITLSSRYV